MERNMFYAISSVNPASGEWMPYGIGKSRKDALTEALEILRCPGGIVEETLRKNLVIRSRSAAIRKGIIGRDTTTAWDAEAQSYRWEN